MQPLFMPWLLRRGEPFAPEPFTYTDDDGSAQPITGHTITAYIRSGRTSDATLVATLTVATVDASAGTFRISLTAAQVTALTAAIIASPMSWGQVWITGPSTGNTPKLIVEANPVSVI